jgi:hypothetical protein
MGAKVKEDYVTLRLKINTPYATFLHHLLTHSTHFVEERLRLFLSYNLMTLAMFCSKYYDYLLSSCSYTMFSYYSFKVLHI